VAVGNGDVLVIVGGVQSRIASAAVGTPAAESAARTVKLDVVGVAPLGVPSITPVPECNVAQTGSDPAVTLHVIGAVHELVVKVCEYATPVFAVGMGDEVVIAQELAALVVRLKFVGPTLPQAFVAVTIIV
jgi:hypothetical protein